EKRNTAAFRATTSGTYVFRIHTSSSALPSNAAVGVITISGGTVTGTEDLNNSTTVTSRTVTGSFNAPDPSSGRGTATFTDSMNITSTYVYYVVDSNHLRFFATSAATV